MQENADSVLIPVSVDKSADCKSCLIVNKAFYCVINGTDLRSAKKIHSSKYSFSLKCKRQMA